MSSAYWLVFTTTLIAQTGDVPPLFQTYGPKMAYYYKSPDPTLGPKMLKDLLKEENIGHSFFAKNPYVLNIIAAQLGDIAAGKSDIVRQYEAELGGAAPKGRKVIVQSLVTCGDKETSKHLADWLVDKRFTDLRPDLLSLQKQLVAPKREHVRDRPAKTPDDLDLLWANFSITGEYAPVARILDVLDLPDAEENEVMKRVANWSLGSNLQQHPKLVELVQKNEKDRPEGSKKAIEKLIIKQR